MGKKLSYDLRLFLSSLFWELKVLKIASFVSSSLKNFNTVTRSVCAAAATHVYAVCMCGGDVTVHASVSATKTIMLQVCVNLTGKKSDVRLICRSLVTADQLTTGQFAIVRCIST